MCNHDQVGISMRKKLDKDVDTPAAGSNSIWRTVHMLFVVGIYFLFGFNVLSTSLWAIVDNVPMMRLLMAAVIVCLLFWIMIRQPMSRSASSSWLQKGCQGRHREGGACPQHRTLFLIEWCPF
jgi:antibiotic biosynthesis monooxygenase (ABM) superfamily enzyme